jgi:hypothetical protein
MVLQPHQKRLPVARQGDVTMRRRQTLETNLSCFVIKGIVIAESMRVFIDPDIHPLPIGDVPVEIKVPGLKRNG